MAIHTNYAMYKDHSIAVVVPAYNEETLIGRVIETMPDFVDCIIIVDDASRDRTVEIVREYQSRTPERIDLIQHEANKGVGGAIIAGYERARDRAFAITAVMAGDAQMDPDDLPALLDPIVDGDADYTKGNRLFTGEAWQKIPHVRYLGNAALSLMTKIVSGYWQVADSQSGYTAASLAVLQTLPLQKVFRRYGMPNDFLVRLNVFSFRVQDVPIKPVYGIGEKSNLNCGLAVPRFLWLLSGLFLWRLKEKYIIHDFHPLIFFYLTAGICTPLGTLMGTYLFLFRMFSGPVAPTAPLFAAFLFMTGIQSAFFAMWMDMQHGRGNEPR